MGVQFIVFGPLFKPFGSVCVECEDRFKASCEEHGFNARKAAEVAEIESDGRVTVASVEVIPAREAVSA